MRLTTTLTVALLAAGLLAGCGDDDSSGPAPTPSTSASTIPATTTPTSSAPDTTTPTTPTTAPPTSATATATPEPGGVGVAYVVDGVLHAPDGTTRPLPTPAGLRLGGFQLLADGRVVAARYDDGGVLSIGVRDGTKVATYPAVGQPVAGRLGFGVAWLAPNGSPTVVQSGVAKPVRLARIAARDATAAALVGSDCTAGTFDDEAGCGVVANVSGAKPGAVLSSTSGEVGDYAAGLQFVTDVAPDRVRSAGVVSQSDDGVCSAVVDPVSGTTVWRSCGFADLHFSPDGAHVVATRSDVDGLGPNVIFVLDAATGKLVGRYRATVIPQAVWEDAEHLVVSSYDGTDWTLQRVALDGSATPVADPVPSEAESPAYLLPLG